jgi:hypothetical protein
VRVKATVATFGYFAFLYGDGFIQFDSRVQIISMEKLKPTFLFYESAVNKLKCVGYDLCYELQTCSLQIEFD